MKLFALSCHFSFAVMSFASSVSAMSLALCRFAAPLPSDTVLPLPSITAWKLADLVPAVRILGKPKETLENYCL